ncbi:MAG: 2-oxo-4-hydroxy-4-carboxy-5-ureidoimidazoline decarboxylase [Planctomycetota bacterium]|nr:MAG: 2-oxo-4-hydroxy-4-carboxy-5-ureidoimidazoline decarboxylase [Planctomycetota bacterium]
MPSIKVINALSKQKCEENLKQCCASSRWVEEMVKRRPYDSPAELYRLAKAIWWSLSPSDWKEAFAAHPEIGDLEALRKKLTTTATWSAQEQKGVAGADFNILEALRRKNQEYRKRFGYIFIVCATGKEAKEILEILTQRLKNSPKEELSIAAKEQEKIMLLRLQKWLEEK